MFNLSGVEGAGLCHKHQELAPLAFKTVLKPAGNNQHLLSQDMLYA